jgi:hypothetical protein
MLSLKDQAVFFMNKGNHQLDYQACAPLRASQRLNDPTF